MMAPHSFLSRALLGSACGYVLGFRVCEAGSYLRPSKMEFGSVCIQVRRGNTLKGFEDFYLKAKAEI